MNANLIRPDIGQWYAHTDKGELFQVAVRDEESRNIEIQYVDGDLDEIDAETWAMLPIERVEPPEDMTASGDDTEPEQDRDPLAEGRPAEPFIAETAEAREWTR